MNLSKKSTLVMLTCGMILSSLVSCGNETPVQNGTENTEKKEIVTDVVTEAETASPFEADSLPDNLDFGGRTFNYLIGDYAGAYYDDFASDGETGARVNDAVYHTGRNVEERLNLKFNFIKETFDFAGISKMMTKLSQSVMAEDKAYDLYVGSNPLNLMLSDKYLLDLSEVPYIDFSKPWWNKSQLNMMPGGAVYVASGDGSLSMIKHTFCMFFNQDKLNQYDVTENLYETVRNHKWTMDHLRELAMLGYRDANGDDKRDFGDEYGLTFGDCNKYLSFQFALGGKCAERTDSGYTVLYGNERMANIFEKVNTLINDTPGVYPGYPNSDHEEHIATGGGNYADRIFMEGRSFFTAGLICDAPVILGNADFSYGVLPYPLYDENQEDYISTVQRNAFFALLSYVDPECSGAVMEAWSSEAYRTIQPEYFETTLKTRYSSDSDMAQMFDLLRSNLYLDVFEYFSSSLDYPTSQFRELLIQKKSGGFASMTAKNEKKWQKKLDEIWDALK
ncbi:MAG: hypothetical protein MJ175_06565 [Clostridia bacterium]|nr:hypothetical protein [Clostridia bacterium]